MLKKKNTKESKKHYEKPQMKKVYSPEHDRLHPFKTIASSCSCAACSSCGGACTGCGI